MTKSTFDTLFEFDKELASKGAIMPYGLNANGDEITFSVAKMGNPKHEKELMRKQKAFQRTRFNKEAQAKVTSEIMADSILVSWSNVLDKDGNDYPPTRENKIAALTKYKELRDTIADFALDNTNYLADDEAPGMEEETEKN